METTSLAYKPLTEQYEIRLLAIKKTQDKNARIDCSLRHVSLLSPPPYWALSYNWGDSDERMDITVNGTVVQVRPSLAGALQELRSPDITICLWVDALCINQNDKADKTRQIPIMKKIYLQARKTVVWLGSNHHHSRKAFQTLRAISLLPPHTIPGPHQKKNWIESLQAIEELDADSWKALKHLLSRPYWSRVWIIQEVAVSRKISVHCGPDSMPWNKLMAVMRAWKPPRWGAWPKISLPHARLTEMDHKLRRLDQFRDQFIHGHPISLLDALCRSTGFQASLSQDKLFGLLGLASDGENIVPVPNYEQSLDSLRKMITSRLIGSHKPPNLDILVCYAPRMRSPLARLSYMPDWFGLPQHINRDTYEEYVQELRPQRFGMKFNIKPGSKPDFWFDGDMLVARGVIVDEIRQLTTSGHDHADPQSPPSDDGPKYKVKHNPYGSRGMRLCALWNLLDRKEAISSSIELGGELTPNDLEINFYRYSKRLVDQFEKSKSTGTIGKTRFLNKNAAAWLAHNSDFSIGEDKLIDVMKGPGNQTELITMGTADLLRPTGHLLERAQKMGQALQLTLGERRRLMVTRSGFLGWAQRDAKVGDKICVVDGSRFPLIARLQTNDSDVFKLVGKCWIEGVMEGGFHTKFRRDAGWPEDTTKLRFL